jgi:alkylhydroperoxidase/carboxymuconolactone decarboxylase family protein YurZ
LPSQSGHAIGVPVTPTKGSLMSAASSETPVLDTLAAMTAESMARCNLDANSLLAARIAALASVGAPAASYLMHIGPAADAGVTIEQVQGILVAVAPIIGTPRTVLAGTNIATALGVAVTVLEAALEAELEDEDAE